MKIKESLSLVITAYNEEGNVKECLNLMLAFLETHVETFEILFVNDGSTDRTGDEADAFQSPNLKVIHMEKNGGSGAGVKEALKYARHEWYCWFPCDLEILPSELETPLSILKGNDIVVTYFTNGHLVRSPFRHLLSLLFVKILNFSFLNELHYFNGISLMKKDLISIEHVKANGFFFHAELLLKTMQKTKNYQEVPIKLTPRFSGTPKAIKGKVLLDVILSYARVFCEIKARK